MNAVTDLAAAGAEHLRPIRSLLVANRSEIAIRVFRAANEMGIRTVAIYADEDRFALHRFKADESYRVGQRGQPIRAYLDIDDILRVAREAGFDEWAGTDDVRFLTVIECFAELVASAEREAFAKVCESLRGASSRRHAEAIRARGEK